MKCRIIINTWVDDRTAEEEAIPFYVKGHNATSEVWRGDLEIMSEREYLLKISVLADGEPQPICDIPFAIGIGHWLWIPPDVELEDEDNGLHSGSDIRNYDAFPGLFRDIGKPIVPGMVLSTGKRNSRNWLPFHHIRRWRRKNDSHGRR